MEEAKKEYNTMHSGVLDESCGRFRDSCVLRGDLYVTTVRINRKELPWVTQQSLQSFVVLSDLPTQGTNKFKIC